MILACCFKYICDATVLIGKRVQGVTECGGNFRLRSGRSGVGENGRTAQKPVARSLQSHWPPKLIIVFAAYVSRL
jgi:hypothetical protein